jgi:hypothetical protein
VKLVLYKVLEQQTATSMHFFAAAAPLIKFKSNQIKQKFIA